MAALTDAARAELWGEIMSDLSRSREAVGIAKDDLRAAANALDDFLVANQAAINNALPAAAKAGLTTPQKARLLMAVVRKRYLTGA